MVTQFKTYKRGRQVEKFFALLNGFFLSLQFE
jgi:hypothetical protein